MKILKNYALSGLCLFSILQLDASPFIEQIIHVLKNNPEHKNDKLMQAIINRETEQVKNLAKETDLNGTPFCSVISGSDLEILKDKARASGDADNAEEANQVTSVHTIHTYLSLAILNSELDKTEAEKKSSLEIIKELLAQKANPNYPDGAKHETYGLGGAIFRNEMRDNKSVSIPYEAFHPLLFEAVQHPCRPEILTLLFEHGANPSAVNEEGQSLLEYAEEMDADELVPVIKQWLKAEKNN